VTATVQADPLAPQLHAGVTALKVALSAEQEATLLAYLRLMEKWNRTHNLTAIREPERMVSAHLLDSLAVIPALPLAQGSAQVTTVIDVGTGGGLPGMALAVARPDLQVTLLDSIQKKTAFLRQAAGELGIANVTVVASRAEDHRPAQGYNLVICRAFSELAEFARLAGHMVADGGWLAAMKGVHPDEEIAKLGAAWRVERVVKLAVPGLDAERHLVLMQRATGNANP
jgi:16S rRNA (guanine527-N7)-methyltransferase